MEENERQLLFAVSVLLLLRVVGALLQCLKPVRLLPPDASDDAAAAWRLYAKGGRAPGTKRLRLLLSVLAAFVACTPAWWRLTRVSRAALPLRELREAASAAPADWSLRLSVLHVDAPFDLLQATRIAEAVAAAVPHTTVATQLLESKRLCGGAHNPCGLSAAVSSLSELSDAQLDAAVARWSGEEEAGAYTLLLLPAASPAVSPSLVFGTRRAAWARGVSAAETPALAASAMRHWAGQASAVTPRPPPLGVGGLCIELQLCNVAPEAGHRYSWWAASHRHAQWLSALSPLASVRVGSTVRSHGCGPGAADALSAAAESADASGALGSEAQTALLDAVRSATAAQPSAGGDVREATLHLVALVLPRHLCSLHLGGAGGLVARGWGGILLWRPPACDGGDETAGGDRAVAMDAAAMRWLYRMWTAQLRQLLGLSATPPTREHLPSPDGFALWEVDLLQRRAARAADGAARDILGALASLVSSDPSLTVSPELAQAANAALLALDSGRREAAANRHAAAAASAHAAHRFAEDAFEHPTLLARLHFPAEHKLAIYLPLLLPALLPLFLALLREARHYRLRLAYSAAVRNAERVS